MTAELEARLRRLEDRTAISECVIRYAISLDRADWELFRSCITDPIYIDFSDWSGMEPRDWPRDDWADFARNVLSGFEARQHLSPNHVITFDGEDRATCISYMYAQHHLTGAEGGDSFLMRGSYTNELERSDDGWRIRSMTQHFDWGEGNERIFEASRARYAAAGPAA